ncbi:MAG: polyhydroxyalkanoic acid synthase [Burkholderiales bacterium RIFCSPHIGHO2_12_FULL_61_11]|nr:MAG: polyhydroxyalkanoic acid synthase [Burkholderiales bacterium RIFCSPHIGHO2_12_FULL_61_11]
MADIQIERAHALGLPEARKLAFKWAEQAGEKFDLTCTYEEGATSDLLSFSRSGVIGTLTVTGESFELSARLGFLLGAFKAKIEGEIAKNLDALITRNSPSENHRPKRKHRTTKP